MAAHEFMQYKNWVVAGNVQDESKFAHEILHTLRAKGFNAEGYHPNPDKGPGIYHDFKALPFKPDVLDLVIHPALGIQVVKDAYDAGIMRVMAQPGARTEEIETWCRDHGMEYVEKCALVEMDLMTV